MPLKTLGSGEHNRGGPWEILLYGEFREEFRQWSEEVQDAALSHLAKLRQFGPSLGRPSVDTLKGSAFPNMKELRLNAGGGVWRLAFEFDPKRRVIVLVGGNKTGVSKDRFYSALIQIADERYRRHLATIQPRKEKK